MKFVKQKRKVRRKQFKPERNAFLLELQLILGTTIETILGKIILKLLISNAIKNVCNVMANDKRNVKFCNLQTVTFPGVGNNDSFFSHRSPHVKGNCYKQR